MQRKLIVKPSVNTGQAKSIAPRSQALKSISTRQISRGTLFKGNAAEAIAQDYLKSQGYRILFHKLRLRYAEIDLLLESPSREIVLCEVKRWRFVDGGLSDPVSDEQKKRLLRCFDHLRTASPKGTYFRSLLVTVEGENVKLFWDFV